MQYRNIPNTDLNISLLGFGNFIFGTTWWGHYTDEDGIKLQNQAFDLGVNFFDTAPAYGNGRAEKLMAQTINYAGRDNLVIATKFGYDFYSDPGKEGGHRERKQDFSAQFIRKDLENSLKRMNIDCIDLYQAHNLKMTHYSDELFETLEKLKDEGKIKAWGIALGPAIGWFEEGIKAFEKKAAVVQTVLNLYEQDPGRQFCEIAAGIDSNGQTTTAQGGIIARVPTNSGILDEEFKADHQFPQWDHRKFRDRNWLKFGVQKNELIRPIAEKLGISIRELAIRWVTSQPGLVSVEPNITCQNDLQEHAAACSHTGLPQEVLDELSGLYENDFGFGQEAHPCDLKSSTAPGGTIPSGRQ